MKFYNENADSFFENTINADMEYTYEKFEKNLKNNGSILELGCGSGRDSKYFLDKGYKVTPTDISEELMKKAQKYIGQEVKYLDMLDLKKVEEYDGIWACASILHIPQKDITKVFENCYRAMKKDGIFYASFKYGEGEVIKGDRTFSNFTEDSIKEKIKDIKFIVEEIFITSDVRPERQDEKWLNIILKK